MRGDSQVRFGGRRRGDHRLKSQHRRLAADPASLSRRATRSLRGRSDSQQIVARLITMYFSSDTKVVRRTAADIEPALLVEQLAEVFEAARPTRIKAGRVRIDHRNVDDLVKKINRATGSRVHRDWRGRVTVSATSPLAAAANDVRKTIAHARRLPFTDDLLLHHQQAEQIASALRRVAT